jgi:excisionase family DNA binding protein
MPEKPFSNMRFYTAAEVADILRLNHQVLARKLQAGEIPAYKIGKDWRIEEGELRGWLRRTSNRRLGRSQSEEETVYRNFFEGGRLKQIPARRGKRDVVLRILVQSFERKREYTEAEVNEILGAFHEDFCTLRRELVMARLLARAGGRYWRLDADAMEETAGEEPAPQSS